MYRESNSSQSVLMSSASYYARDFWVDNADPKMSEFVGMNSPWPMWALGAVLCTVCLHWGPLYMSKRKPRDLKPIMLIYNGTAFGTLTCGVLITLYLVNYLSDCMSCDTYEPHTTDLKKLYLKYISYVLVLAKLYDFGRPLMMVMSKQRVATLHVLHLQMALMITWSGAKMNPGSIFILFGISDCAYQAFCGGYLVMTCASDDLRPSARWRQRVLAFRMVTTAAAFAHGVYFLLDATCSAKYELRLFVVVYTALLLVLSPYSYWTWTKSSEKCHQRQRQNNNEFESKPSVKVD